MDRNGIMNADANAGFLQGFQRLVAPGKAHRIDMIDMPAVRRRHGPSQRMFLQQAIILCGH